MSFQPVLPLTGYTGWGFLKRTIAKQQAVQQAAPAQQRDEAYFRDKIGKADTAEKLVNDKRLLRIALTAFGLEGDLNSKAFVQKILEGGTLKEGSLANKLADKQLFGEGRRPAVLASKGGGIPLNDTFLSRKGT